MSAILHIEANDFAPAPAGVQVVRTCKVDSDCVVKDVGSCCGYSPACVHRNSPTDPTFVVSDACDFGKERARLLELIQRFVELAAQTRQHEVAEVRSAVALDDAQVQRLAQALSRATGKSVEVKVVVDPTVMGGLVATVGDTVIDGSVRHRLEQLKETL